MLQVKEQCEQMLVEMYRGGIANGSSLRLALDGPVVTYCYMRCQERVEWRWVEMVEDILEGEHGWGVAKVEAVSGEDYPISSEVWDLLKGKMVVYVSSAHLYRWSALHVEDLGIGREC